MKSNTYKKIDNFGKNLGLSKDQIEIAKLKSKIKERIRKKAEKSQLSMTEIAEMCGLTRSVVSGIINGSLQSVSLERLIRLAYSLDLSVDIKIKGAA